MIAGRIHRFVGGSLFVLTRQGDSVVVTDHADAEQMAAAHGMRLREFVEVHQQHHARDLALGFALGALAATLALYFLATITGVLQCP